MTEIDLSKERSTIKELEGHGNEDIFATSRHWKVELDCSHGQL